MKKYSVILATLLLTGCSSSTSSSAPYELSSFLTSSQQIPFEVSVENSPVFFGLDQDLFFAESCNQIAKDVMINVIKSESANFSFGGTEILATPEELTGAFRQQAFQFDSATSSFAFIEAIRERLASEECTVSDSFFLHPAPKYQPIVNLPDGFEGITWTTETFQFLAPNCRVDGQNNPIQVYEALSFVTNGDINVITGSEVYFCSTESSNDVFLKAEKLVRTLTDQAVLNLELSF